MTFRYYLKGPKAGKSEIFADLPGFPDNVNYSEGKFSVAIISVPDSILARLPEWPIVRKLLARMIALIELAINEIDSICPSDILKKTAHMVRHSFIFKELYLL